MLPSFIRSDYLNRPARCDHEGERLHSALSGSGICFCWILRHSWMTISWLVHMDLAVGSCFSLVTSPVIHFHATALSGLIR
jgi:hypothetical protein